MIPRILNSPSHNPLGSDDRGRLRAFIITGVAAQVLLLVVLLALGTLRLSLWLMIIAGIIGEVGALGVIIWAWLGLERRLAGQDRDMKLALVFSLSLELDALARMVVEQLYKAVPTQGVLLYQWHGEHAALGLLARISETDMGVRPAQEETFKHVAASRRPASLGSAGEGRWWVAPLFAQGRTIGLIVIREHDTRALTRRERQLAERISRLAAVALHNAITFSQIDANLRARIIELSTIEVVSRRISATLDADVIANDVLAAAMSAIEAEVGSCLLKTHNGEYSLVARIDSQGPQPPVVIDGQRGFVGQVLRTRKPVLISDVRLYPNNEGLTPGMRSQLGVPILREDQSRGVLYLEDSRANAFTVSHIRLVNMLAEHAAIALENARLYDEIRTGRDQLQAILDSTRDAVLLFDSRGRLLQFNPVAQEMLGRLLAPYLGRSFLCWLRETGSAHLQAMTGFTLPQFRRYVLELMQHPARVTHRQFQHVRGESVIHISETGSPVCDQQGNPVGWLLVWRDNTEERQLDMLRQEFSSMVVHDLRNPITSVISGMSMLYDLINETPIDREALYEVTQITQNSAEHMLNLVQSLLDISRLEQSTITMDCESMPLADSVGQAVKSVLGMALEAGITITISVPDDLPPVWIDDEKIQRVLINLLDNALRHTPRGGQITIEAGYRPGDQLVTVRVEDTGPGIPAEARSRIFDKFVQLDPQRVLRGHKGTGLGLTFCKLVIEVHKGHIWVEDGTTGGAAFCFTLPVVHMHDVLLGAPE